MIYESHLYCGMQLEFSGPLWYWKGPAPWYFVTVPNRECTQLKAAVRLVTYGWGMIPVRAWIGETQWKTSLFPKIDRYIVPVRTSVRKPLKLEEGDIVTLRLELNL